MAKQPLDIPPGIVSNDTSYSEQATWRTTNNMRFRDERLEVTGGWEAISATPVTGACRNMLPWRENSGSTKIALGTHTNLYVWDAGELADVTPVDLDPGNIDGTEGPGYGIGGYGLGTYGDFDDSEGEFWARTWSLYPYGEDLMASPRGGSIYWWVDGDTSIPAEPLLNAPEQVTYMMVHPSTRAVLAFGCVDGNGDYNPRCIRGSDLDGKPTDWTPSNSNNAFEDVLGDTGLLVAARMWGDLLAVWTTSGLYSGLYIGDPSQEWRWQPVEGGVGLLGPNAAVVVGQTLYWITPDLHIWSCAQGEAPSMVYCPILSDTLGQMTPAQGDKVVMSYIASANEVRIDYPDQRDGFECSRYFAVCLTVPDGGQAAWSRGTQARTAFDRGAPLALPLAAGVPDQFGNSMFYYHETAVQGADGGPLTWSAETNDFVLDEDVTAGQLLAFWPDFKSQVGTVNLTIFARMYPQDGNEHQFGPYPLAAGCERVDLRITGKIFRMRLDGSSYPAFVRLGRPIVNIVPTGTR